MPNWTLSFTPIFLNELLGLPQHVSKLVSQKVKVITALDQQRRLFYVGCSRAMRALLVCGSLTSPSSFAEPLVAPFWQRKESV